MSNQKPVFKAQYENFIGGEWVAPVDGEYFDNASPIDGSHLCRIPKSNSKDIDLAVEAAQKAAAAWGKTPASERCNIMFKIAERIEERHLQMELLAFRAYDLSALGDIEGWQRDLDALGTLSQEIGEPFYEYNHQTMSVAPMIQRGQFDKAAAINAGGLAGLGELVERLLCVLKLLPGIVIEARRAGALDHLAADGHQPAAHGEIEDDARIIVRAGGGGDGGGELFEIAPAADFAEAFGGCEKRIDDCRRREPARRDQARAGVEDDLVHRIVEMFGLQVGGDAIEYLVVEKDCAK